jgi:Fe-S cluster biogenesis protein NfuA
MIEWVRVQALLAVLDRIRPILQADGMNVELLDVQDKNARIRLTGLCARCGSAGLMLQSGLEEALRQEIRDFGELQLVYEAGAR